MLVTIKNILELINSIIDKQKAVIDKLVKLEFNIKALNIYNKDK